MKVFICQSNYIPWKGYFDAIQRADVFVMYDEAQYTKRDWRNRNRIKTPNGLQWLSIPVKVKGKFGQKINETEVLDRQWAQKHWKNIVQNYRKAPFFQTYEPVFEALYHSASDHRYLSQINYDFLTTIAGMLGITTRFCWSSEFNIHGDRSERLLNICQDLQATHYITGPSARDYLEVDLFRHKGMDVIWMDYSGYLEYPQLFGPFEHPVSILDLLFNTGPSAASYLKFFSRNLSEYSTKMISSP